MRPIDKIEAGAEQIYDEFSHSITTKYNEFTADIDEYFHMKLRSVAIYAIALALLLGGFCALCIFLTFALAGALQAPAWQVAGVLGLALMFLATLTIVIYRQRTSQTTRSLTEQMKSNADKYMRSISNAATSKSISADKFEELSMPSHEDGIDKVKNGLAELFSPSYHIRRSPLKSIGAAALTGLLLGALKKRSESSTSEQQPDINASRSRHRKESSSGFFPTAYALVAPLVVNAVRKKVTKGIEDYIKNFDPGSFLSSREEKKKEQSSFSRSRRNGHAPGPIHTYPHDANKDRESHISYLKH